MSDPERILIVRPSALGDVCRTVPVLASLRVRFPRARIDWLVQEGFEPAIAAHPALTGPVRFPRSRLGARRLSRAAGRRELNTLLRRLRRARYDLVLDCQGLGRSGFFAWSTRAERRIGFADSRELGWLGVNDRCEVSADAHTVDRMLALARHAGAEPVPDMRLFTSPEQRRSIDERLSGARFALLAPTSRWPGKRWPADRFAALAGALLEAEAVDAVAFTGATAERDQCLPLAELASNDDRVVDLVGAGDVGTLLATVEASTIVIANDSAALHMAVGFDKPLVGLYGPTRLDLVGPYQREDDVIQPAVDLPRNRHKDEAFGAEVMARITTRRVVDAALARVPRPAAESGARPAPPRADLWR